MTSGSRFWTRLGLEFAHFSGYARLAARRAGGVGGIVRFERVRPAHRARFQPLKSREITPEFLQRAVQALRRWNYEIVSMDEVCRRAGQPAAVGCFVSLTFDGGYRDVATFAYPVLSRLDVPFTLYVPTAFPDGLGEAWWLALERIIADHDRISLVMDRTERHFTIDATSDKYQLYDFLAGWMKSLPPPDRSAAINDLCKRYSVDLAALSRDASMTWRDLTKIAADPRATIGTATVNYPVLTGMKDPAARREITMGKAVAEAALGRELKHFAYPFGDRDGFAARHVALAEDSGFSSAVSAVPGLIRPDGRSNLHALPRLDWDGRYSLRAMRSMLAGVSIGAQRPREGAGN